jgi:hypothetical protein
MARDIASRAAALVAALPFLLVSAAPAGEPKPPADVALPFNPADGAVIGDWARYALTDPAAPGEALPPELYAVRSVDEEAVLVEDTARKKHRYPRGAAGASALAFVRGFFGEDGASQLEGITSLAVTADPVEVGGRRFDAAVRIDVTTLTRAEDKDGLRAEFRIWIAPGVRAGGIVKAAASVRYAGKVHEGLLSLDGQGGAADDPRPHRSPAPPAPAGATPATPTGSPAGAAPEPQGR